MRTARPPHLAPPAAALPCTVALLLASLVLLLWAAMLRVPGSWRPLALRPSDLGHARPPEAARGSSTTTPTTTTDPRITEWLARLAASGGGNSSDGGAAQPLLPIQWMHTPKTGSTFGLTAYRHGCNGPQPLDEAIGVDCGRPIYSLTHVADP